ncbi:hypothetical protein OKW21_006476 [Catalinimonas alkaloidigena]|uniref:hypothetical protein n=1 Tax=Catalinimonas alkaloidigena TaxID=1075417 RepID=UPI00240662D3|nr:hypothetical protein [Catalinimonas alkaloidigena]MDF9801213.1 hypothetical protein [Catalinimonas alkaloidigena]
MDFLKARSQVEQHKKSLLAQAFIWIVLIVFSAWLLTINSMISLGWFFSFEEITAWKLDKTYSFFKEGLRRFDKTITPASYQFSKYIAISMWMLTGGLFYLFFRFQNEVLSKISKAYLFCKKELQKSLQAFLKLSSLEQYGFWGAFLLSLVLRIYHYYYMPVHIDELMSYYFFVNKGVLLTSVYYPFPNNHLFFNYVFWFFSQFLNDPILAGRLPSIIFYHLLLLLLFMGLLRYIKSYAAALFSVLICVLLFPSSIYAVEARGYSLMSFLALVAGFSLLLAVEKKRREAFFIFVPACVFGACTVPVFFIPFMAFMMYGGMQAYLQRDLQLLARLLVSSLCIGVGVLLCYLPMFIFSGVEAVAFNEFVAPIKIERFYSYVYPVASAELLSYLAGTPNRGWIYFLIVSILGLILLFKADKRVKNWFFFTAFMLGSIFLYALLFRSFMFQRTITYVTYFLYPSVAIVVVFWVKRITQNQRARKVVFAFLLVVLSFVSYLEYQENSYEVTLLPNVYYDKLEAHINEAVRKEAKVYMGISSTYVHVYLYYQYLTEKYDKPANITEEYQQADFLVLEATSYDASYFASHGFTQCDALPSKISFLYPLIICKK